MNALISNEFLKLRTSRAPWLILAIQQILIVAAMSGMAIAELDFKSPTAARLLLAHAGMSSLLIMVLGILAVAGEYRDGTTTDTFLATPRRSRVIAAKLVAYTGVGVVSGLLTAITAFVEGIAINLLGDVGRWLPMASGMALDNLPQGKLLPQVAGGLVLVGYAILFAAVATLATMRSDVA